MALADRVFDALKAAIQLSARVESLGNRLEVMAREVRELDRRLIRVETALELASTGKFSPLLPPARDKWDHGDR
jgi:hypothetical protein